ncbi:phosphatidylinositol 3,4,5-trisphosphate 3-phosphatase and dual-specificity protein phosphatase PTEN [Exaiptasia diaphana]|uniref:Phosphatidylinositol 3,4,5-trisphosphate 3-phosphatase and dual-specificity protein phosphatase PTEN n=1 Tax=Exaiptasia diaphana TaxID=2652724 RepID=A0A913YAK0_EXADI|nr:phosphatidylinositol 3,4,5-trisphosphate 3-phosphatase and dual-specificity protein phosphatase PTEN [Exaiptasia diaphana]KXJ21447.1 Phosphatidylinositol 3,4,5-trisphosphate 3-phosphatase and dual-specificity protein phosphatase PTEN [Exaiptasia diaphana]
MSYFKQLVSKKKRRFKEGGFDLDLTYIKPNIVAMGFPSENIEGVYRNHMDEVYRFLEQRHKDHYKVYNLCSERQYDPSKFHQRVATYPFDDHNAPPFELIKPFCDDVDEWLKAHKDNVAIIHCKAGKGRTGVMICAYLRHNGHFDDVNEALKYYGNARTRNAKGVTIPSQRRYVCYYDTLIRHKLTYEPTMVLLERFEIITIPNMQNGTCSPYFTLWQYKVKIHQSKVFETTKRGDTTITLPLPQLLPICGDIRIEFFHKEKFSKERIFQFWFNTFFISVGTNLSEDSTEISDPALQSFYDEKTKERWFALPKQYIDKAHKDEKCRVFQADFKVKVFFKEVGERENIKVKGKKSDSKSNNKSNNDAGNVTEDEDNFSDTDNEETWAKEETLV